MTTDMIETGDLIVRVEKVRKDRWNTSIYRDGILVRTSRISHTLEEAWAHAIVWLLTDAGPNCQTLVSKIKLHLRDLSLSTKECKKDERKRK